MRLQCTDEDGESGCHDYCYLNLGETQYFCTAMHLCTDCLQSGWLDEQGDVWRTSLDVLENVDTPHAKLVQFAKGLCDADNYEVRKREVNGKRDLIVT